MKVSDFLTAISQNNFDHERYPYEDYPNRLSIEDIVYCWGILLPEYLANPDSTKLNWVITQLLSIMIETPKKSKEKSHNTLSLEMMYEVACDGGESLVGHFQDPHETHLFDVLVQSLIKDLT